MEAKSPIINSDSEEKEDVATLASPPPCAYPFL